MIKVLVVEDSKVVSAYLVHLLLSDPKITVVGTAANGLEAIAAVERYRPDVITMDIIMPQMNGYEACSVIMQKFPTPIVVVTSLYDPSAVEVAFKALAAGALAVVAKPQAPGHPDANRMIKDFLLNVKLMSEVKVVQRHHRIPYEKEASPPVVSKVDTLGATTQIIVIGSSTGGQAANATILSALPKDFSIPILIVQHIAVGFIHALVDWLSHSCNLIVEVAINGEKPLPGHVYFAPDKFHLEINSRRLMTFASGEPENILCPSVDNLFNTVANVFGKNAVGVLLSGMGSDGADGLKKMHQNGALTIAQDEESCVVFGMPKQAIQRGAATHVLPPQAIAEALIKISNLQNKGVSR